MTSNVIASKFKSSSNTKKTHTNEKKKKKNNNNDTAHCDKNRIQYTVPYCHVICGSQFEKCAPFSIFVSFRSISNFPLFCLGKFFRNKYFSRPFQISIKCCFKQCIADLSNFTLLILFRSGSVQFSHWQTVSIIRGYRSTVFSPSFTIFR